MFVAPVFFVPESNMDPRHPAESSFASVLSKIPFVTIAKQLNGTLRRHASALLIVVLLAAGNVSFVLPSALAQTQDGSTAPPAADSQASDAASSMPLAVEVTATDRAAFSAMLLAIDASGVKLSGSAPSTLIPLEKLRSIRFIDSASEPPPAPAEQSCEAVLLDGSVISCTNVRLDNDTAEINVSEEIVCRVPASTISHIRLQNLNQVQLKQWRAIAQSRLSADSLVLIGSPESLEKLEGIVLGINAEAVKFDFGGTQIDAPLPRLAGVSLFAAPGSAPEPKKLRAIVTDRFGGKWMASELSLPASTAAENATIEVALRGGANVKLPLSEVREIDFSSGSMVFVADLPPVRTESAARFDVGLEIPLADTLFGPRPAKFTSGFSGGLGPSLEFLGGGSGTYRIPTDFSRLVGQVELRPSGRHTTAVTVVVRLENKVLFERKLDQTGQPLEIDVPVEADQRLRLEVRTDADVAVGDVVLWRELRLLK